MLIATPVLAGIKVYIRYKFNLDDEEEILDKPKSSKRKTQVRKSIKKGEEI